MLDFNENGYLIPHQIIETDLATFEKTFVFNEHREKLFTRYVELLNHLKSIGLSGFMYVDGSFTTLKTKPKDIDLAIIIDAEFRDKYLRELEKIKENFEELDIYFVPQYQPNSPQFVINELEKFNWFYLFSFDRDVLPKGVIQINF